MQYQEEVFSGSSRAHRRRQSMGKAKPVTDLLLNFPPPRTASLRLSGTSDGLPPSHLRADGDIRTEAAFDANFITENGPLKAFRDESGLEVLVSDGIDGNRDGENEQFQLVGKEDSCTPCLRCTGADSVEILTRPNAINEMCEKLCTDGCRLQLSLAGYVPPVHVDLATREVQGAVPKTLSAHSNHEVGLQLDPKIEISKASGVDQKRKQFLNELLSGSQFDAGCRNQSEAEVNTCVGAHDKSDTLDAPEIETLRDLREKSEIAEALAKTSEMTSTSQVKQRLTARKLEIQLENPAVSDDAEQCADRGVPLAGARLDEIADKLTAQDGSDYEPPRDLLLYFVRVCCQKCTFWALR